MCDITFYLKSLCYQSAFKLAQSQTPLLHSTLLHFQLKTLSLRLSLSLSISHSLSLLKTNRYIYVTSLYSNERSSDSIFLIRILHGLAALQISLNRKPKRKTQQKPRLKKKKGSISELENAVVSEGVLRASIL